MIDLPPRLEKLATSRHVQRVLPTACAQVVNRFLLQAQPTADHEIAGDQWGEEIQRLFDRSEQRLSNLEAKGPGLAATAAIVGAAIVVAVAEGWDQSTLLGKALLGLSAVYMLLSLVAPLAMADSLPRNTVAARDIEACDTEEHPHQALAILKIKSASANDLQAQRLANVQSASRDELVNALGLFSAWVVLGPLLQLLFN